MKEIKIYNQISNFIVPQKDNQNCIYYDIKSTCLYQVNLNEGKEMKLKCNLDPLKSPLYHTKNFVFYVTSGQDEKPSVIVFDTSLESLDKIEGYSMIAAFSNKICLTKQVENSFTYEMINYPSRETIWTFDMTKYSPNYFDSNGTVIVGPKEIFLIDNNSGQTIWSKELSELKEGLTKRKINFLSWYLINGLLWIPVKGGTYLVLDIKTGEHMKSFEDQSIDKDTGIDFLKDSSSDNLIRMSHTGISYLNTRTFDFKHETIDYSCSIDCKPENKAMVQSDSNIYYVSNQINCLNKFSKKRKRIVDQVEFDSIIANMYILNNHLFVLTTNGNTNIYDISEDENEPESKYLNL